MRKILTAALCLMAVMCLCTGALAADLTLLSREAENSNDDDYFYPQQLLVVGDTLYILCCRDESFSLYRWQEGMDEAELLTDALFRGNRFNNMEEALAYVEHAE
ncbi:MAG: hypothetical protein ACI4MK_02740, partial [Aristaeellaceae bacterium]